MRSALLLLALSAFAFAEKVSFKTEDGITIVGTWQSAGKDAPTVICLPMFRNKRESYKPLIGALVLKGLNVLAIDLRGHGESAPDLAGRVRKRDAKLFLAMHMDVGAAIEFLVSKKDCDRTRIGLVGASVGCSVAIDYTRRHPGDIRAVVLLTPGSNYLGVNSLEQLEKWPGTAIFTFVSTEERGTSKGVMDALDPFDGSSRLVVPGKGIHGTRMFGKVNQIEELIANFFVSRLVNLADLRASKGLQLRRKGIRISPSAGALAVHVPEGFKGSATVSLANQKSRLKFDGTSNSASLDWSWKPGTKLWVEVRSSKGAKIRFPSKGRYALMPLRDDG